MAGRWSPAVWCRWRGLILSDRRRLSLGAKWCGACSLGERKLQAAISQRVGHALKEALQALIFREVLLQKPHGYLNL